MQDTLNDLSGVDPFRLNAYTDTKDWITLLDRDLVDADMTQSHEHGIDLTTGALVYLETYQGGDGFVRNIMKSMAGGRTPTHRQMRAALNVMRREYAGLPRSSSADAATLAQKIPCYSCDQTFDTFDALMAHKSDAHGPGWLERQRDEERKAKDAAIPDLHLNGEESDVIADTVASKGLDLSNLPDGRYAVPNTTGNGKDAFIYLRVARARRTAIRDKRYRYGQIVTGNEVVLAGTIEVRRYISDTQELVGQQKPGDLYRGDNEADLDMVLMSPETFAKMFGMQMGSCCICGKQLTDDISRALGMGLECEKKEAYFTKPEKWIKHFEASCPCCDNLAEHEETFTKPGGRPKFQGFDYRNKLSGYECPLGHKWTVDDKGKMNVTAPSNWVMKGDVQ